MKERFLKLSRKISFLQVRFLLILLYILIISPMALIWKLIRKDPLNRAWKKSSNSYMIKYEESDINIQSMDRPY